MKITKLMEFEMAHRVVNCVSERCKYSYHGHSYKIEVTLKGSPLTTSGMVMDFALFKKAIKPLIDSFDHCWMFFNEEDTPTKDFIITHNRRWVSVPFNPSAELMAVMFVYYIQYILKHTRYRDDSEDIPEVESVRLWETRTGSATATPADVANYWNPNWAKHIEFSEGVKRDWTPDLNKIMNGEEVSWNTVPMQLDPSWCSNENVFDEFNI